MKKTFLNREKPLLTCMIQEGNVDNIPAIVKNGIADGADAFGLQMCRLDSSLKTEENLRNIFEHMGNRPSYITNYRFCKNESMTDEECMAQLVDAVKWGGTLIDMMGDTFNKTPKELTTDSEAIKRQMELIEKIHGLGGEVLMSSHVLEFTPAERVIEIALEHQRRGADISKIVTFANTADEEMENLCITRLLKKELDIPFLFLSGGKYCNLHRAFGAMIGCSMVLCVQQHNDISTKAQPILKAMRNVFDNVDFDYGDE